MSTVGEVGRAGREEGPSIDLELASAVWGGKAQWQYMS
jgi:hypothetical protein